MKFTTTTLVAAALIGSAAAADHSVLFSEFKAKHAKTYATKDEENNRFEIFVKNLSVIEERNTAERAAGGSAVHGVTKFSDLLQEEFEQQFLTADVTQKTVGRTMLKDLAKPNDGSTDWTGE
jgi:hypothetical protein